jgi:hypothetical protein
MKTDGPFIRPCCLLSPEGRFREREHLFDPGFFAQVDLQPCLARVDSGFPAGRREEVAVDGGRGAFVISAGASPPSSSGDELLFGIEGHIGQQLFQPVAELGPEDIAVKVDRGVVVVKQESGAARRKDRVAVRRVAVPVAFAENFLAAFERQGVTDPIVAVQAGQPFLFEPGDERVVSLRQ